MKTGLLSRRIPIHCGEHEHVIGSSRELPRRRMSEYFEEETNFRRGNGTVEGSLNQEFQELLAQRRRENSLLEADKLGLDAVVCRSELGGTLCCLKGLVELTVEKQGFGKGAEILGYRVA
jgi:hypothetical protein